ncbi:type I restriction enzyme, S subunit [Bathymodiolus platifrons methanotrophic gill symbiont]|uniref:restriction endonuclease subunit S n=1 Tax=Bathymodiolus platifrons methanotrophic gill symbiont TaxID=113268 RepID=UPI000B415E46|nr:restriction endonuclease subunit S [Bathymodiolus platifrons methanotrophic gill symbiont]GAW86659.1 type I restriction enzyme, S subunit [Bathymodiolus platifrons methanotrophic gill symbiont]
MSKQTTKTLVPKLRFPEFRDVGPWEEKRLGDFDGLIHGDGDWILSKDISMHGQFEIVQLGNIGLGEFIEKPMKTISINKFKGLGGTKIIKDDLLINRMVDRNLYCCIFKKNGEYITSVDVCWIRNNSYFNNYFLMNLILHDPNQRKLLSLSSGSGRVRISKKNLFKRFNFFIPQPDEQQKIADCLSSIDDLITAQAKKIESLKDHKKGLMQQLFTAEGEAVPKLRFPEFLDAGEWEEGVINDLANGIMGNSFKSIDFIEDGIQLIRMGNLYQGELQLNRTPVYLPKHFNEEYSRFLVKPLDLLMSTTGTMGKKDYGFIVQIPESCEQLLLNQRVLKIVHKANCIKGFLLQLLKSESLLTELYSLPGGTKQANLSSQQFKGLKVKFPESKEQQKIADCLSSVDDLITAQAQKIESLKTHKKGLMQQLFPATDGVGA